MTTLTLALGKQYPRRQIYTFTGPRDAATDDYQAVITIGGRQIERVVVHFAATGTPAAGSTGRLRIMARPDPTLAYEFEAPLYRGLTSGYIAVTPTSAGASYGWLTTATGTNLWPAVTSVLGTGVYQYGGLFEACFHGINLPSGSQPAALAQRFDSLRLFWAKGDLTAGFSINRLALLLDFAEA